MICMSALLYKNCYVNKKENKGIFATWAAVVVNTMLQMRSASKLRDGAAIIL
jgi:hypothetical protein